MLPLCSPGSKKLQNCKFHHLCSTFLPSFALKLISFACADADADADADDDDVDDNHVSS